MTPAKQRRAGIYVRISQDRNASNAGVKRQEDDCRSLAEHLGWTVVEVYSDNDISAYSGKRRPAYEKMWADVAAGRIDAVLAYHPKRLYRRIVALENLVKLAEAHGNIPIKTVAGGEVDLSTAAGRAIARIMAALAQMESEEQGERISRSKKSARKAGLHLGGGHRPWGYDWHRNSDGKVIKGAGLKVVSEEAAAIREAVARILQGETPHRIVQDFRVRNVPAPRKPAYMKRSLIGRNGSETLLIGGTNWPAIISRDEARAVKARLTAPSKHAPKDGRGGRRSALTGLLFCAKCGSKMLGSVGHYRCAVMQGGCGGISIKARPLEDHLDLEVQRMREHGRTRDEGGAAVTVDSNSEAQQAALAEIAAVEARQAEIHDSLSDPDSPLSARDAVPILNALDVRLSEASARYAEVSPQEQPGLYEMTEMPDDWHDRWIAGELTPVELSDLHAMFAAYVERVTVSRALKRGSVFDPERVAVTWRST